MSTEVPLKRGLVVSAAMHVIVFVGILLLPRGSARWDRVDAIAVELVGPLKAQSRSASPPAQLPAPAEAPAVEETPPAPKEKEPEAPKPKPKSAPKSAPREPARRYQPLAPPSTDEPSLEERLRTRLDELAGESDDAASKEPAPATPAPSGVGDGDSPTSSAEVSATDFPYAWYLNLLRTKISDAWDPPASRLVAGGANQVIVRFRLARSGAVSDVGVEILSGAPGLDSSARRAVDRAQPFPPLPGDFADDFVDIAVRFTVSEGKR
jgi:TonB family protein